MFHAREATDEQVRAMSLWIASSSSAKIDAEPRSGQLSADRLDWIFLARES